VTRTREEALGYSKGYAAAARSHWHRDKTPAPPDEIVHGLLDALIGLRDEATAIVQVLCEDDDFSVLLVPRIDAADEAIRRVREWLVSPARGGTRGLRRPRRPHKG